MCNPFRRKSTGENKKSVTRRLRKSLGNTKGADMPGIVGTLIELLIVLALIIVVVLTYVAKPSKGTAVSANTQITGAPASINAAIQ